MHAIICQAVQTTYSFLLFVLTLDVFCVAALPLNLKSF